MHPGPECPGWGEPGLYFLQREVKKEKYAVNSLEAKLYKEFPAFRFCQRKIFVYAQFFFITNMYVLNDSHYPLRANKNGVSY